MAFIILEGLDRSGKSSVASYYEKQGYKVVHLSAPDKKYSQMGYTGPSYLDEMVEMYTEHAGQNVVFDRSPYGELIWPAVYGREPLLSKEDIETLQELENQNDVQRILMFDQDAEAHWRRCVANKEPLTRDQFKSAAILYNSMSKEFGFQRKQLKDFKLVTEPTVVPKVAPKAGDPVATAAEPVAEAPKSNRPSKEQQRLERANVINDILNKRIIKGKSQAHDEIENEVRSFLNAKLGHLLGTQPSIELKPEVVQFVTALYERAKSK